MNEFYRNYLDEPVSRQKTNSRKWDHLCEHFGYDDILPAGISDMDFRTAPAVSQALLSRATHEIYGYTDDETNCKTAESGWLQRRYDFSCKTEWIIHSNGVVSGLVACVRALTKTGDRILIQPPVYSSFYTTVERLGRRLLKSPLVEKENGYFMDFEHIEAQFAKGVRMMLLCNPHNPVGRVWNIEELQRLIMLANNYHVIIVSDEVHAGFILDTDCQHTCLLSLSGTDRCIMLTSASKSFNLSGLHLASVIAMNPDIRQRIINELTLSRNDTLNLFASVALCTAYTEGDEWLNAVCEYIRENRDFVLSYIQKHMPSITCHASQGTYLMWLDFSGLHHTHQEISDFLLHDAHVLLTDGRSFGSGGTLHFRLNIAAPRSHISKVLKRIHVSLENKVWPDDVREGTPSHFPASGQLARLKEFLKKHISRHRFLTRLWYLLRAHRSNVP